VRWFQQQHEKIRRKRDYQDGKVKFPDYSSDFANLLRQLAPQVRQVQQQQPRLQYRNTDSHSIFPDPLFKEQWYLVSRVCVDFSFFVLFYLVDGEDLINYFYNIWN
jgi:proprotein convertase subtilisin/kexin type 5